ncbi:hypothetical protein CFOL_v3_28176, partial [Cephalotus follicularis]
RELLSLLEPSFTSQNQRPNFETPKAEPAYGTAINNTHSISLSLMAEELEEQKPLHQEHREEEDPRKLLSSYLGLSFSIFLAYIPKNSLSLIPKYQTQVKDLSSRLYATEEQLKQMKSRRKEDSKANARVVEIFASHRNAWQAEEKKLLLQIDSASEEIASLRVKMDDLEREKKELTKGVEDLEREVGEREEMIGFMSRRNGGEEFDEEEEEVVVEEESGGCGSGECYGGCDDESSINEEFEHYVYEQQQPQQRSNNVGFGSDFLASSASKFWAERASLWQDVQYESLESLYHLKHYVARRESPWKVDGNTASVSSKLKLLEQELMNLENVGKSDLSKVPSAMRKQAKRYQALAGKIDDLCRRMQASDPCEPTLSPEFRTQRQTEFLLEAFRLQQRASETAQKLMSLQSEIGKSYYGDVLGSQAKLTTRRSLDSIRNNLKDIQRNLEIWLARIIGDLEGLLARDGSSRVRECYISSRYPFGQ